MTNQASDTPTSEVNKDALAWVDAFKAKHGRPPRILHIGNIANNAYINSKLLNEAGLDCDVICYDYYHIMGCPEWEDADFEGEILDQFWPDWSSVNLNGFKRPKWFAQGPARYCIEYLVSKREGRKYKTDLWWWILGLARWSKVNPNARRLRLFLARIKMLNVKSILNPALLHNPVALLKIYILGVSWIVLLASILIIPILILPIFILAWPIRKIKGIIKPGTDQGEDFDGQVQRLIRSFADTFPEREDKLTLADIGHYRNTTKHWQRLFSYYDIVQAYSTDPILPLVAGIQNYTAFEHGTLRVFTLGDDPVHRLTSLAYNQAKASFVTNGDCLEYAKKIKVKHIVPMLHPIDERRIRKIEGDYENIHAKYDAKYLLLCPLRHDWTIKGTDKYIRALPLIADRIGKCFKLILTSWGNEVEKSRRLASKLGVDDLIIWIEPLNRASLLRMIKSCDILCDQIALPVFGATAPEGIAAEVPVIMSYDSRYTDWLIKQPAPLLSAWNETEIAACVEKALDPAWKSEYKRRAREWFDANHSYRYVVQGHLDVYSEILGK
jgi:hypothetical protein